MDVVDETGREGMAPGAERRLSEKNRATGGAQGAGGRGADDGASACGSGPPWMLT